MDNENFQGNVDNANGNNIEITCALLLRELFSVDGTFTGRRAIKAGTDTEIVYNPH